MPICVKCNTRFANRTVVNGKPFLLNKRKYCLECSPIGTRRFCGPKPGPRSAPDNEKRRVIVSSKRRKRKEMAVKRLGGKCAICGYDKCIAALDFHHKNRATKTHEVSSLYDSTLEKFLCEVDKCELLCCRCHAELHDGDNSLRSKALPCEGKEAAASAVYLPIFL